MRKLHFIYLSVLLISLISCRKDFVFQPSSGGLEFSKNTVYLDTVFKNIGSSTYRLKVYNRSNKDISIPTIQLAKGTNSKYRIMVDGKTGNGKIFNDVELMAKDSLYIFIEVTADVADANPTDFLYTDQIQFANNSGAPQTVDLVTLIQDAIFIYPDRPLTTGIKETLNVQGFTGVEGHTLTTANELNWTATKPYVIYGYAAVPNGQTLTIQKGASIHFHANSGLVVDNGAQLIIDGDLNATNSNGIITTKNEVTFEGDRLEPSFEDTPGQWGTVLICSSLNNTINHLTLKNASVGILLQANSATQSLPNVTITNSQFYNCSNYGILGVDAIITGSNDVINYCGQADLACTYGGTYNFANCTFNNNWNSSKQVAVYLSDYTYDNDGKKIPNNSSSSTLTFQFINSIIYGSNQIEYFVDIFGSVNKIYTFNNCLFKYQPNDNTFPSYMQSGNTFGNIKNVDPKFKNINKNQLNILAGSSAINAGVLLASVPKDILGLPRNNPTSIGAYESVP